MDKLDLLIGPYTSITQGQIATGTRTIFHLQVSGVLKSY